MSYGKGRERERWKERGGIGGEGGGVERGGDYECVERRVPSLRRWRLRQVADVVVEVVIFLVVGAGGGNIVVVSEGSGDGVNRDSGGHGS